MATVDDPRLRRRGVSRAGVFAVGACVDRGRLHPHPVRLRRSGAVPLVLPVARHGAGARAEPLLLGGAVPPDRDQPAGADQRDRPQHPARARHLDLGPGRGAERGVDHRSGALRVHRLLGHPALGALDAGRVRRRPALRLFPLRPREPGIRPPHDGRSDAAPADPGRPRRDPDPPAPRRARRRGAARASLLRAVLPVFRDAGHRRRGGRDLPGGVGRGGARRRPARSAGPGTARG